MWRAIRRYRRQAGVAGFVFLVLIVALSGLLYVLPIKAASHPHSHGIRALPTSAHAVSTTPSTATTGSNTTDWPMFHYAPAHSGVNAAEQLLSPSTVPSLGLAWTSDVNALCGGCHVMGEPTVAGGVVYIETYPISTYQGTVYALSEATGKLLWSYTVTSYLEATPAVVGGVVYINNNAGTLYAFNATTGKLTWSYDGVNAGVLASPTVVGGVVYVGATAVNATTGKLLWSYSDSTSAIFNSSPAVANGVVYVIDSSGLLYALNATTGALLWKYTGGGTKVAASPVVANGVVYMNMGTVYAINATTGALLWSYTGSSSNSTPTVAGGVVYVGQDKLYAFDATTGKVLWSYSSATGYTDAAVANGVAYIDTGTMVYALDATTGGTLWSYTGSGSTGFISGPVVANGMVFASSVGDGVVYAFHSAIRLFAPTR